MTTEFVPAADIAKDLSQNVDTVNQTLVGGCGYPNLGAGLRVEGKLLPYGSKLSINKDDAPIFVARFKVWASY